MFFCPGLFASQGVSIAQMMYVSKYKSHKIALFNSMKKSNIAPISEARTRFLYCGWGTFCERERERERERDTERYMYNRMHNLFFYFQ